MGFVHFHNHSEYSSLDGGSRISDMPAKLKSLDMNAMGLTDHGVMQGLPDFYKALKKAEMKPILGCEIYLTNDRFDKSRGTPTWHLTLIAETTEGYKNLCKISSFAFIDGVISTFGRPRARADWDLLRENSKGIIAFTGCMAGPVMGAIFKGDLEAATDYTSMLIDIFGKENVYGEIQNVGIEIGIPGDSQLAKKLGKTPLTDDEAIHHEEVEAGQVPLSQTEANQALADICEELGPGLVATGDTHYLNESDADPHDSMICIGTGQLKNGHRRFSLLPKKYHMRSEAEMREALKDWPESIDNTVKIAARCNAEIEFGRELLPAFPIPEGMGDSKAYIRHLCDKGFEERYGTDPSQEAIERLDFELGVIDNMGFNDYFLIVWDLFNEARLRNIATGPGRGSAAGSIVAYTLGITQLDPLEYGLLFERFLNPDRISMPDIDMDFSVKRREEIIEYAREKYNSIAGCETAVAQIVTFGKFKAKGALRDAARTLASPSDEGRAEGLRLGDRLAKMVPANDPKATMTSVLDENDGANELNNTLKKGGAAAEAITLARWLEGFVRTNGIHAAAVLIASHDLSDDLPLQKLGKDKPLHVQYDMHHSEDLGLLKMDFLGLRNLDVIQDTCERIKHTRGIDLTPADIPLDDKATYEMFARGESVGTFQFEGGGMQGALKEVKPTNIEDLIALVALYRPGPMMNIPAYAARKNGKEKVEFLHPKLEPILNDTYAITIYQEQSMRISRAIANFTPGQADDLRKAIGKKLRDKMAALKGPFMEGCAANGVTKHVAELLWDENERSADYSFNKSHAACYGLIAYQTGYLKRNYGPEYMASLIDSVRGKKDKPRMYLTEAKRMGLTVLPPDVNRSFKDYTVLPKEDSTIENDFEILFGLTAIKGVGAGVVESIREEREKNGLFTSVFNLIERMPQLNKGVVQNLVKAGALSRFGVPRKAMHDVVEDAIADYKKRKKDEQTAFVKQVRVDANEIWKALPAHEKRGLEAAAKIVLENGRVIDTEQMNEAIDAAVRKDYLRQARADARAAIKEHVEATAGLAGEDASEGTDKEQIDEKANAALALIEDQIKASVALIKEVAPKHIQGAIDVVPEDDGLMDALDEIAPTGPKLGTEEWDEIELLNTERSMLGVYVTGHPLDKDEAVWWNYLNQGTPRGRELSQLSDADIGSRVIIVGAVVGDETKPMKKGGVFHITQIEDLSGSAEVMIFKDALEGGLDQLIAPGNVVCIDAEVKEDTFKRDNKPDSDDVIAEDDSDDEIPIKLIATRLYRWDAAKFQKLLDVRSDGETRPVVVKLPSLKEGEFIGEQLKLICSKHPARAPLKFSPVRSFTKPS